jgi:hypothetical protein
MWNWLRDCCAGGGRSLACLSILVFSGAGPAALADEHRQDIDVWPDDNEVPEMTLEEFADTLETGREMVGRQLDEVAATIDSFFDDERLEGENAEGRLRLGTSMLFEAGEPPSLDADVNFSLDLPNTEERLRLVVTGSLRRDDDTGDDRRRRLGIPDDDEDRRAAADLRYALLDDLQSNLDARIGLRINGFTPAAAFGLRYRRSWDANGWTVRMTHEGEWETKDGFEAESFLDFETEPAPNFFFRATPEVNWEEDEPGFRYGFGFTLTHRLAERRFLQYSLRYRFETEPDHGLDEILLRARYRQTIFRDWVFGEVAPQIRLADEDGIDGTPGVMFRVQVVF